MPKNLEDDPLQKRYLPISVLTALLFLVAIGGYMAPTDSEALPVRVLLDNKGGKVILKHADHVITMNEECGSCHHTTGNDQNPPACSQCHAKKFDEVFKTTHQGTIGEDNCISCHHAKANIDNFSHDDHMDDYTGGDCQSCHHDESIEAEPQACANCHKDGSNSVLRLRDANHTRCADCHEDAYQQGITGCSYCHTREPAPEDPEQIACGYCHIDPVEQLLPTSMNAFHGQCMGCHEESESGPFGDDACYQCHMK